jgi:hypothetical protein
MRSRHAIWGFAVALIAAIVGAWYVGNGDGDEQGPVERMSRSDSMNWQQRLVLTAARASQGKEPQPWPYAGLRGSAEPMPQPLRRAAIANMGGYQQLGLRFDSAQYAKTEIGGGIWVVRGAGVTCIFHAKRLAASCTTDINAMRQGVILVVGDDKQGTPPSKLPEHFLALGIAPNGVKAVRLQVIDGPVVNVLVVENAYALRAAGPITLERLIR